MSWPTFTCVMLFPSLVFVRGKLMGSLALIGVALTVQFLNFAFVNVGVLLVSPVCAQAVETAQQEAFVAEFVA